MCASSSTTIYKFTRALGALVPTFRRSRSTFRRYQRRCLFIGGRRTCGGVSHLSSWVPFADSLGATPVYPRRLPIRLSGLAALEAWLRCKICLCGLRTAPPRSRKAAEIRTKLRSKYVLWSLWSFDGRTPALKRMAPRCPFG
jgi:hypothetical protein